VAALLEEAAILEHYIARKPLLLCQPCVCVDLALCVSPPEGQVWLLAALLGVQRANKKFSYICTEDMMGANVAMKKKSILIIK